MVSGSSGELYDGSSESQKPKSTGQGIIFAVVLLLYEILVICLYAFLFSYNLSNFKANVDVGGMILTSVLTLAIVAGNFYLSYV